jgi:hypothetical protein
MRSERERILNLESSLIGNTVLLLRTNQALVELIQGKPHAEILEALTATVTEEETNHASETALGKSL